MPSPAVSRLAYLTSACALALLQGLPLLLLTALTSLPAPSVRAQSLAPVAENLGFTIVGIESFDFAGYSISNAGDVNGDGLDDIIVGAFGANPLGRAYAGEAYVIFGKTDAITVDLRDIRAGLGGFSVAGSGTVGSYDRTGESVSGAGDVNGDGLADLIVGAKLSDLAGLNNAGESYIIFGKTDTTTVDIRNIEQGLGGFVIQGADSDDRSGNAVSSAGDVNGDGLADLLVGAYAAEAASVGDTGLSYVVFGKTNTIPVDLKAVEQGQGGFVIVGQGGGTRSGTAVSHAGDINGDGLDDVLVGTFDFDPTAGQTYVVLGKTDTNPVQFAELRAGQGGFVVYGISAKDYAGVAVSGAGDVNNDGLADFIVGAPTADVGGVFNAGESYVIFGKTDTRAVQLALVRAGSGGFGIFGQQERARCGYAVSEAGDINQDGFDDVIMLCDRADPEGRVDAGEGYVIFGKTNTARVEIQALRRGQGGYIVKGASTDNPLGKSLGGGGDVNGDGRPDTLFGSPDADQGPLGSVGVSYVLFGKNNTLPIDLQE
ncbi:integrin alpha [Candidatus Cyanaurora vandensis]|uniref:integrin alpha n=1 Tax=Candidatus Cyanaurora vandensis TaxID=2714958 RepID=UPI0025799892|nr:integrin alpha [Candidatus Cyanaurora vandensis]